jgi:prepilin-type N-terminal cleavage/methylation domain-containing protein
MYSRNSGFTLIELLVALTIMVMVTTVAFGGFRIGIDAWERGTKAAERLQQRSSVERLIRRQLPVAMPRTLFRGNTERLEFVSDYSLAEGPADFRKVDYAVKDGQFFYDDKPFFEFVASEPAEVPTNSLARFSTVSFEYYGEEKGKPAWLKEWSGSVPDAMRIKIDSDSFIVYMVNH